MTNVAKQEKVENLEGQTNSCTVSNCASKQKETDEQTQLKKNLSKIRHKIAIISGKGGVGKSTVTANLAMAFAMQQPTAKIGILDADLHGPCIPKMLGLKGRKLNTGLNGAIFPVTGNLGIKAVSMDFILPNDEAPVIWRGPLKMRAIQQFLSDVTWGELDYLFIDLPPGTGDEPLSIAQLIPNLSGVIIVTMPSEVSQAVVKKAITFARQIGVPIIGIVENMSGFICPDCGAKVDIFKFGGGKKVADEMAVPYLGSIPLDPMICTNSDEGLSFVAENLSSPATKAFVGIVKNVEKFLFGNKSTNGYTEPSSNNQCNDDSN